MSARVYLDFDLQIDELNASTYRVRVLNSPAGQAETTFALPFSEQDLEIFFLRIGRPRRGMRSLNSPEMNEARNFGSKLYKAVFQDALQACLLRSIDKTEQQNAGLRLRLRLPPSLMDLPWEYLYDAALDRFFSHSINTPIVRYLDLAQSIKPLAVTPPLKVLVMIASPSSDYEALDVEDEWQKINAAVAELAGRGLVHLTRLPTASLSALQKQLRREQYHILHFVGHGGFDQQTQDGVLLLEDDSGRSRFVNGNALGTLLHDHPSLRLVLLNACEGARATRSDPFAGVAQQLVRQGIPAVIAMQFEITDKAAVILAREFYDALADGYPVDGALAEARKSIFTAENDIEWGTPVLYMRAPDGHFFEFAQLTAAPVRKPQNELPKADEQKHEKSEVKGITVTPFVAQSSPPVESSTISEVKRDVQVNPVKLAEQKTPQIVQSEDVKGTKFIAPSTQAIELPTDSQAKNETQVSPQVVTTISIEAKRKLLLLLNHRIATLAAYPSIEFDWVVIPAGAFLMGSDKQTDPNARDDELPQHRVTLSEYAIARVPVTNAQYKHFVDATHHAKPSHWTNGEIPKGLENHPVVYVSWQDAVDFCQWAKVRLPTEAEWEKAARGTDGRIYPWGNQPPSADRANFSPSGLRSFVRAFQSAATTPVENYPLGASPYGLLHMAGNVWEHVAVWYNGVYYANSPTENPQGPTSGIRRVVRGGSFVHHIGDVRCAYRFGIDPDLRFSFVGFRVVSPGS